MESGSNWSAPSVIAEQSWVARIKYRVRIDHNSGPAVVTSNSRRLQAASEPNANGNVGVSGGEPPWAGKTQVARPPNVSVGQSAWSPHHCTPSV